jgi:hypothetical protein
MNDVGKPYNELEFCTEWLARSRRSAAAWTDAWLSCGGTEAQLALMLAQREHYVRLYQSGPVGWGPVPTGCMETQEAKYIKDRSFDMFTAKCSERILDLMPVVWRHGRKIGFKSPLPLGDLPVVLPSLWMLETEVVPQSDGALWWSREAAPSQNMLWDPLLYYCWTRAYPGSVKESLFDGSLAAIASGRIPVGIDGDIVIAFRIDPARMQKDITNEKRRRKGDNWPTFAPKTTPS